MFEKVDLKKLIGTDKKTDPRFLDFIVNDIDESDFIIAGYPDDEGIKNNGGRPGASLAPNQIRKYLYKMRPSILSEENSPKLYDYGNLKTDKDLMQRHNTAINFIERLLDQGKTIISLGGGHDYGYVDGKAFLDFCSDCTDKPLIVNFDAHFDVRPFEKEITSGTPFYRLLEEDVFHFVEVGIQEQCNMKTHYNYIKDKGGHVILLDQLLSNGYLQIDNFIKIFNELKIPETTCFLSIDIDAFSNAYAPGCSQSFATGLTPEFVINAIKYLVEKHYVRSFGVYEVSPELDFDDITSKLAALMIYKFINFKQSAINKKDTSI